MSVANRQKMRILRVHRILLILMSIRGKILGKPPVRETSMEANYTGKFGSVTAQFASKQKDTSKEREICPKHKGCQTDKVLYQS